MTARQTLELRNHQQLALTPQLQQSIRLLQLSAQELEHEIAQAVLDNPLLERQEEYDIDRPEAKLEEPDSPRDEWPVLSLPSRSADPYADSERPDAAQPETLGQHLLGQLRLTRAGPRDLALITLLIEELDENGYLPSTLDDMAQCLPSELEVDVQELEVALRLLQSFDPAGVGARSLAECLLLQMALVPVAQRCDPSILRCARQLAERHLDLLASGNLTRLREALGCTQDVLRQAHALLLSLEPRPGRAWAGSQADYVNPDVLVHKAGRRWLARLNPSVLPKLRVHPQYESWLGEAPQRGLMHEQLQQARGLIKNVHQRFETILRVAQAIVDRQQAFFEQGAHAMRPLLLRDIAQALEMHESTVSRATRQKFVATPCGVLELKYFFGVALDTDDGLATSATAVRSLIAKLVSGESSKKPLSDSQIATSLGEQGVTIARRTVAKYREAAGIESASLRRARATLA
ncbi:RNA polymerase RpoN-/SigL-like sigma 54 subunit [Paralcaligenes ureilyticus]|uniref:RNA polymerase sigma-54 factor n=2 Tax=Paralcaligenes ureilyticus TaxID=627131 RepID=A0A4R3M3R4_9BURK|nr:RNA polymerase RpoN-/SigL-like sigma 54 subunit [Paralcaligenes ureilyticus]